MSKPTILLATGNQKLDGILTEVFEHQFSFADAVVDMRRFLFDIVAQHQPQIVIVHEKILSDLETRKEKDEELLILLQQIRTNMPTVRIVLICSRQVDDPFLLQLTLLGIYDIVWNPSFQRRDLLEQLLRPANILNVKAITQRLQKEEWKQLGTIEHVEEQGDVPLTTAETKIPPSTVPGPPSELAMFEPSRNEKVVEDEWGEDPEKPPIQKGSRWGRIRKGNEEKGVDTSQESSRSNPFQNFNAKRPFLPRKEKKQVENTSPVVEVRRERAQVPSVDPILPETFCLYSTKGGVGTTAMTLYLAAVLEEKGAKVGVVDLAYPYGTISSYLNCPPSMGAIDLIQRSSLYFSEDEWSDMTVFHEGIRYYLPPNIWPDGFVYNGQMIDKLIRNMQRSATMTLIDLNSHHSLQNIAMTFGNSTRILWILDLNAATIFQTKRQLIQLREQGFINPNKITFMVNRVATKDIPLDLLEDTLETRIEWVFPDCKEVIKEMNKHVIFYDDTEFSSIMEKYVQTIVPEAKGGRFKRFW